MRSISIGQHAIPLWLVVTLVLSGVFGTVLANHIWTSVIIDLEVEEPLKILHYPKKLSLYPGETKEFNVTIKNSASRNYTIVLDFSLDNTTYQDNYVTFSDETYTVIPNKQNLTAWLQVEEYAPPIDTSLTIDFRRIAEEEGEVLFFDDFNDGVADRWTVQLGNFEVVNGEYYTDNGFGEKSITTVDGLTFTDCIIEVNLRFSPTEVDFCAGIVFRYLDNGRHYTFEVGAEASVASFCMYTPETAHYGQNLAVNRSVIIDRDIDYSLRVHIEGNKFTAFLNGEKILSATDDTYTEGQVGLRAQRADVFFDNFTVYSLP